MREEGRNLREKEREREVERQTEIILKSKKTNNHIQIELEI